MFIFRAYKGRSQSKSFVADIERIEIELAGALEKFDIAVLIHTRSFKKSSLYFADLVAGRSALTIHYRIVKAIGEI